MPHTYANRDIFWSYLGDEGADQNRAQDALVRTFLEGASRRVDEFCRRTGADLKMSGFGPVTKANTYDADEGETELDFDDDLLALTSLEVRDETNYPLVAWTEGDDFILRPYSGPPWRGFVQPDNGSPLVMGYGYGVVVATGKWGFEDRRAPLLATVGAGDWTADGTSLLVSDAAGEIAGGMTLWCGTEALYVRDVSASTLTVDRAAHGTTAATHTAGAALHVQEYDPRVVTATAQIANRRWKVRDLGLGDVYGATGGPPTARERAMEIDILRAAVGELAFEHAG